MCAQVVYNLGCLSLQLLSNLNNEVTHINRFGGHFLHTSYIVQCCVLTVCFPHLSGLKPTLITGTINKFLMLL